MKKAKDKAERALILGKAAKNCRNIADVFESLDRESSKLLEALTTIDDEIDKAINNLKSEQGNN